MSESKRKNGKLKNFYCCNYYNSLSSAVIETGDCSEVTTSSSSSSSPPVWVWVVVIVAVLAACATTVIIVVVCLLKRRKKQKGRGNAMCTQYNEDYACVYSTVYVNTKRIIIYALHIKIIL